MTALTTFVQIQNQTMLLAGMSGATDRALVKDAINIAYSDMWTRHPWPFKKAEGWAATKAPYSTGTVEATGADELTLTGGTWPSDVAGMKIGIPGLTAPWYRVSTRDSDTAVTLDRSIPGYATLVPAGTEYYAYSDEVSLAAYTDIEALMAKYVYLHDSTGLGAPLNYVSEDVVSTWGFPRGAGRPAAWTDIIADLSTGVRGMRLGTNVPDDIYQVHFYYLKNPTALSADGDTPLFPASMRHIMVPGALRIIYKQDEFRDTNLAERAEQKFESELLKAWRTEKRTKNRVQYVRPFDYTARGGSLRFVVE